VAELFEAISMSAYGFVDRPRDELLQYFTAPTTNVEEDVRLAFEGEHLVGYVDADTQDGVSWWSEIGVATGEDPTEIVPHLLEWAEQRSRGAGVLRTWAPNPLEELRAAIERAGYERSRASYRMQIDLTAARESSAPVDGIDIRTLDPDDLTAAYEAHQEAFQDSWEFTTESYDEWRHWLVDTESFDPTLWFLAWDRSELAGEAFCRVREETGFIGVLAVRRPWRRKGLGRALLLHAFDEFAARGFDRVALGVDAQSLTGADRLYESVGMRVIRQVDFFEKRLG
jgi:mycothiol synthase